MNIALVHNVPTNCWGGEQTFLFHLCAGLRALGHTPVVLRVGKRHEKGDRLMHGFLPYTNVNAATLRELARDWPMLVTTPTLRPDREWLAPLIEARVPLVLHDPAEFEPWVLDALKASGAPAVSIRPKNKRALDALGVRGVFIPHPYAPRNEPACQKTRHAVSIARVDFRKRTEIIIQANRRLPPEQRVQMHGDENRIYGFQKLDKLFPGWRADYHGRYPGGFRASAPLVDPAKWMVDLTDIPGDGGGTQYTFFEAWDAHAAVVVNRTWITGSGDDVMLPGQTCRAAGDVEELVELLKSDPDPSIIEGGRELMRQHDAAAIAAFYTGLARTRSVP